MKKFISVLLIFFTCSQLSCRSNEKDVFSKSNNKNWENYFISIIKDDFNYSGFTIIIPMQMCEQCVIDEMNTIKDKFSNVPIILVGTAENASLKEIVFSLKKNRTSEVYVDSFGLIYEFLPTPITGAIVVLNSQNDYKRFEYNITVWDSIYSAYQLGGRRKSFKE